MLEEYGDYEILEFAISREINAYNFYTAMAEKMTDEGMAAFFKALAEDELRHKAQLELELIKIGKVVDNPGKIPELGEPFPIMSADSGMDMEYKDSLVMAISKEDTAFKLYASMATRAQDKGSRQMLFALAEEELRHKMQFEDEYQKCTEWEEGHR